MLFQRFLVHYLNSNIQVSLSGISLCYISCQSLGLEVGYELYGFVFFGMMTMYSYLRGQGVYSNLPYKRLFVVSVSLSTLCALFLPWCSLLIAGISFCISHLYLRPIFPFRKSFRAMGGLTKILVIAFCWSMIVVLLPLSSSIHKGEYPEMPPFAWLDYTKWIWIGKIFVFILALMIPFEIRDLRYDSTRMHTLPQQIGKIRSQYVGLFLILIFFVLGNSYSWIEMSITSLVMIAILYATKSSSRLFTDFWVEGIPILWAMLLWLSD